MPFSIRPHRRFPVHCADRYNASQSLKLPLAYFSGFWLLITLLLLCSGSVYAEWVAVSSSEAEGGVTAYLDPTTIYRKGDLVKFWDLTDYKTLQTGPIGSYFSIKVLGEYDCVGKRMRSITLEAFSDNMSSGKVLNTTSLEGTWRPIASGTIGHDLWKFACGKQ